MNVKLFLSIAIVSLANFSTGLAMNESANKMLLETMKLGKMMDVNSVKAALDAGATIDLQDPVGFTALHWAVVTKSPRVIQLLLKEGANVNIKNNYGDTALDIAKKMKEKDLIDPFFQVKTVYHV